MTPILEMRSVTKEYRGIPAVSEIDFDVYSGEIHALLGENGAGKSTLTKIIAGAVSPTRGEVWLDGAQVSLSSPKDALSAGIAMVYQENSLVPTMTVAQNIFLGTESFYVRLRGINIAAQQILQSLHFSVDPTATVSSLGVAQRQMVEIARAVHYKARILIFDEPTATLTPEEKRHFFALMHRLIASGVAVIFITHALEEALQHAQRITILRDGQHILTEDAKNLDREKIIQNMVGRSLTDEIYSASNDAHPIRSRGQKVLSVQNLSMGNLVRNTSFSIFAGQITGMFGLIGSGRTETAKIISGIIKRDWLHGGIVKLGDRPIRYRTPEKAVFDGIVYVTEDRKVEGFFENMSIDENIYMGNLARNGTGASVISLQQMHRLAKEWTSKLNIKAINGNARVVELSGGNQQKVVIAKSLAQKPQIIFFDEPTRGVDVGAIAEIHQLIRSLADAGLAVVVISSYLPEVLNIADRILVTRQGRVVEEFSPADVTEERIMYAAVH